jgi:hypothetical protein
MYFVFLPEPALSAGPFFNICLRRHYSGISAVICFSLQQGIKINTMAAIKRTDTILILSNFMFVFPRQHLPGKQPKK